MAGKDSAETAQSARIKALLVTDQLTGATAGSGPEITNGAPLAKSVLAQPGVRRGLVLLVAATVAVVVVRRAGKQR